jgi:hypothetical protein
MGRLLKNRLMYLSAILLLIGAASVMACTSPYTKYVHNSEVGLFSFEYPKIWQLQTFSDGHWDGARLFFGSTQPRGAYEGLPERGTWAVVWSCLQGFTPTIANAHEWLETFVAPDYLLAPPLNTIERSKPMIDGVEGESMSFSIYGDMSFSNSYKPSHMTCQVIGVDYKGRIYIFMLAVNTDLDSYEEFKPGFDHILKTFKFLN